MSAPYQPTAMELARDLAEAERQKEPIRAEASAAKDAFEQLKVDCEKLLHDTHSAATRTAEAASNHSESIERMRDRLSKLVAPDVYRRVVEVVSRATTLDAESIEAELAALL